MGEKQAQAGLDTGLRQKLIDRFVARNGGVCGQIREGLAQGDCAGARRLAHTLKSNAGQLGLQALQNAAEAVEHRLGGGAAAPEALAPELKSLEAALEAALAALAPEVRASSPARAEAVDAEAALALLRRAEALLDEYDTACLELAPALARIPGGEAAAAHIEDFAFDAALAACRALRARLEKSGKDGL